VLFVQSEVKEHAELHLLLSMVTPLPWLERVPTFKDQQEQLKEKDLNTYGFLGYPLLQTADIIVYRATSFRSARTRPRTSSCRARSCGASTTSMVPFSGAAAALHRHAESARARRTEDVEVVRQHDRTDGERRRDPRAVMTMFTDPNRVRRTDPGNPDICNLFQFHKLFSDDATIARVDHECRTAQIGCVQDKKLLAEIMIEKLAPMRARREEIDRDPSIVWDTLARRQPQSARARSRDAAAVRDAMKIELSRAAHMSDEEQDERPEAPPKPARAGAGSRRARRAAYQLTLPSFQGPLDLLLHLIKKHEVDIYDIPILLITDQYNAYLDTMAELDLDIAADYIYMAALLINIKSRMLLPRDEVEGEQAEDPRKELVDRSSSTSASRPLRNRSRSSTCCAWACGRVRACRCRAMSRAKST
jgi:tryptophanyl-tRNA synthetase